MAKRKKDLVDKVAAAAPLQGFAASSSTFTGNLYREILRYVDDNFVVSPLALEAILGLVRCGSRDETAQEIKTALSFPQNPKDIESVIKTLNPILKQGKNFLYFASNRIYIERKCSIKKEFKTIANEVYEIELEHIDFVNAARRTQTINNWVKTETAHKIADFLTTADVDGSSKMILISATYFTVNWLKFFQRDASSRGVFKISPTRSVDVNFMEKTGIYNYCESTDLKAKIVEMPLENKILELVMVLPNEINGLAFIESRLNAAFVDPKYKEERVNVIMPKVSFDFKLDLRKVFQHLGVKKAFNTEGDFSGIAAEKSVLFINHLIHKSVVSFSDEASDVGSGANLKTPSHAKRIAMMSKSFVADHPFIFYIKSKNVIIFAGRVVKPT